MKRKVEEEETIKKKIQKLIKLPNELLVHMISYLKKKDIKKLRLTNKSFSTLCLSPLCINPETSIYIFNLNQYKLMKSFNLEKNDLKIAKEFIDKFMEDLDDDWTDIKEYIADYHSDLLPYTKYVNSWKIKEKENKRNYIKMIDYNIQFNHKCVNFEFEERNDMVRGIGERYYIFNYTFEKESTLFTNHHFNEYYFDFSINLKKQKKIKESIEIILEFLGLEIKTIKFLNFLLLLIRYEAEEMEESLDGETISLIEFDELNRSYKKKNRIQKDESDDNEEESNETENHSKIEDQ